MPPEMKAPECLLLLLLLYMHLDMYMCESYSNIGYNIGYFYIMQLTTIKQNGKLICKYDY